VRRDRRDLNDGDLEILRRTSRGPGAFGSGLVRGYYFLTPAFILLDYAFGVNLRMAPIVPPGWKLPYYVVCMGIALLMAWKPLLSHFMALLECSLNILLLILSLFLPVYHLMNAIGDPGTETPLLTMGMVVNFILSGIVWTIAFYANPLLSPRGYSGGNPCSGGDPGPTG